MLKTDQQNPLLVSEQIIIISEEPKPDFVLTPNLPIALSNCCGSYFGNFMLKVTPVNRIATFGQNLEFDIEIDNSNNKLPISDVTAKLHHYLVLNC